MKRNEPDPGVYIIKNVINERVYIGSAVRVELRLSTHFSELRRRIHINPKLQADYNTFGGEAFIAEVIECMKGQSTDDLRKREVYYINTYNSKCDIYNCIIPTGIKNLSTIAITISPDLRDILVKEAASKRITITALLRPILEQHFLAPKIDLVTLIRSLIDEYETYSRASCNSDLVRRPYLGS